MNTANDKYGSSLDRTLGAGKPVDPATRLSELLAQSLEELTRPFDPPRPGHIPARIAHDDPAVTVPHSVVPSVHGEPPADETSAAELNSEESRIDADRALAELEAELFAAARQVDREQPVSSPVEHDEELIEDHSAIHDGAEHEKNDAMPDVSPQAAFAREAAEPVPDADAARVIAKVRKLMLVSMAVTVIAVGSVFAFIGYRISKGEGTTEKKADKLPESSPIPTDITLSLPRGARIVQSAVAADRLVMTLEIDGRIEVRTFDVKTLQPAGRLNFSATP